MLERRRLGFQETVHKTYSDIYNGAGTSVGMVGVQGPLTSELVLEALGILQRRHPLLRAHFKSGFIFNHFVVDNDPRDLPFSVMPRNRDEQWKEVFEQDMHRPFGGDTRYLWRVVLLKGNGDKRTSHEIVASFHHAIIDGVSLEAFFIELLEFCRLIHSGVDPSFETLALMPPVEESVEKKIGWPWFVVRMWRKIVIPLLRARKYLWRHEVRVAVGDRRTRCHHRWIDGHQLDGLLEVSRTQGIALTSLLTATLIKACSVVQGCNEHCGQVVYTPVNLRDYCNPSVSSEHIGYFVGLSLTAYSFDSGIPLLQLAIRFDKALKASMERDIYQPRDLAKISSLWGAKILEKGPFGKCFPFGVGVSNIGRMDFPVGGGPFEAIGLHVGSALHHGTNLMLLFAATVGDRMFMTFCHEEPLLSKEGADLIVNHFFSILGSALSNNSSSPERLRC